MSDKIIEKLSSLSSDPTKYFGCELGAQTQIDLKNERYIVNGSHDADKLQEILDGFIEKFVLCPDCENPETVLVRFISLSQGRRLVRVGVNQTDRIDRLISVGPIKIKV